jgi:hypothetical protein
MISKKSQTEALTFVSLNIEKARHFKLLGEFLMERNPHVLCLQEVPRYAMSTIQKILDARQSYFLPITLHKEAHQAEPVMYGLAMFSNVPVKEAGYSYYTKQGEVIPVKRLPENKSYNRALVWMSVIYEGQEYCFVNVHHTWTPDGEPTEEQLYDTEMLLRKLKDIPEHVLGGDTNAPRGKKTHDLFCERYTDHIPEVVKSTIDPVLHRAAAKKLALVVDVLFSTPHSYAVSNVEVVSGVSDHCAIVAEVLRHAKE